MKFKYEVHLSLDLSLDKEESTLVQVDDDGPIEFIQIDAFDPAEVFVVVEIDCATLEAGMAYWSTNLEGSAKLNAKSAVEDYIKEYYNA